jgi:hypothetical protein
MRPLATGLAMAFVLAAGGWAETAQPPAPPAPTGPHADPSACEAQSLAYLVGHPKTDIPVSADLSHRRVACTTCPVSDDFRPDRTNFMFDEKTGLITAVKCG